LSAPQAQSDAFLEPLSVLLHCDDYRRPCSRPVNCRRAQVFARVPGGRIWAFGSRTGRGSAAVTSEPVQSVPRHAHRPPAPSSFFPPS
jgi:hypothetical protein